MLDLRLFKGITMKTTTEPEVSEKHIASVFRVEE
jgi:hypothetical protein